MILESAVTRPLRGLPGIRDPWVAAPPHTGSKPQPSSHCCWPAALFYLTVTASASSPSLGTEKRKRRRSWPAATQCKARKQSSGGTPNPTANEKAWQSTR
jgi:hypothetical protein